MYADATDLTRRYGTANLTKWGDMSGTGTLDANRIADCLAAASDEIDTFLEGGP